MLISCQDLCKEYVLSSFVVCVCVYASVCGCVGVCGVASGCVYMLVFMGVSVCVCVCVCVC